MIFLLLPARRWVSLLLILFTHPPFRVSGFRSVIVPHFRCRQSLRYDRVHWVTPYSTIPTEDAFAIEKAQHFTHQDIKWIIRPCEDPSWRQMWQWRFLGCLNFLQYLLRRVPKLPLFPIQSQNRSPDKAPPSRIVLYAFHQGLPIGRFGIVPDTGGSAAPEAMQQAAERLAISSTEMFRAAAIIYMFVEPEYRGRSVGSHALSVISHIHSSRGCLCTVLVANDSQARQEASQLENAKMDANHVDDRLVQWYERHGFIRAPELQELLGSPNGIYGITMMAPTMFQSDAPFRIQWW